MKMDMDTTGTVKYSGVDIEKKNKIKMLSPISDPNVGPHPPLQSDIGGYDIRLGPMSFIMDIGLARPPKAPTLFNIIIKYFLEADDIIR